MGRRRGKGIPLTALMLLPSIAGVLLVSILSWYLFNAAVERTADTEVSRMSSLIRETGNASLSYSVSVGHKSEVEQVLIALTRSPLVFAAEVRDVEGDVIARYQNADLPLEQGIQIKEYREKLYYIVVDQDPTAEGERLVVGEVLYQLTPHLVNARKLELQTQYRYLVACLVALVIVAISLAAHYTLVPIRQIRKAMGRLALGENDARINDESIVGEMRVIQDGVNQLAESLQKSAQSNHLALTEKEDALEKRREADRLIESAVGASAKELADPLMVIVKQLRVNRDAQLTGTGEPLIDTEVILGSAEELQITLLGMMGKMSELRANSGMTEITLEDYFRKKTDHYEGRFRAKGLELFEQSESGADTATYKFDVRLVDIVLGKVLENALGYTHEGTVRLKWDVESSAGGHTLSVVVEDTGRGIESRDLERVFGAFYRSSNVVDEGIPGSGLGLYIAQEIAVTLGGSITVESEVSYGSRFNITLPIERQDAAHLGDTAAAAKTVLLVGVRDYERRIFDTLLGEQKLVVVHANTSIEGLVMMSDQAFDYLIIEEAVNDPDIDTLIEKVKKLELHVEIGVVTTGEGRYDEGIHFIGRSNRERGLIALLTPRSAEPAPTASPVDYSLQKRFGGNATNGNGEA